MSSLLTDFQPLFRKKKKLLDAEACKADHGSQVGPIGQTYTLVGMCDLKSTSSYRKKVLKNQSKWQQCFCNMGIPAT